MIALAAKQVGDKELTRKHGLKLKSARPWLAADANSLLVYGAPRRRTRAGYKDAHADFGNGRYNDHHFHYGYLVHASAAPAPRIRRRRRAPTEAEQAVSAIVMDCCSPFPGGGNCSRATCPSPSSICMIFLDIRTGTNTSWASGLFSHKMGSPRKVSRRRRIPIWGCGGARYRNPELGILLGCVMLEVRRERHYGALLIGRECTLRPFLRSRIVGVVGRWML